MRLLIRGLATALILWISTLHSVSAQTLPDDMVIADDQTKTRIARMLANGRSQNMYRYLQQRVVCVDDPNFARFLTERSIKAIVVTRRVGATAVASGECNLFVDGRGAFLLRVLLRDIPAQDVQDDVPSRPDPTPADKQGPEILPLQNEFTASSGAATVVVDIVDPSGVARADAAGNRPSQRDGKQFDFNIKLPNDYQPQTVRITAVDRVGNSSARRVTIRRIPACGPSNGLNRNMARIIQTDLNVLGFNAGSADGLIGSGSCAAIQRFTPLSFRSWADLQDALARARVSISASVRTDPSDAEQMIVATVSDPRNTNAVRWVRVTTQRGGTVMEQSYQGRDLSFPFQLAPGETRSLVIEALDDQTRGLAETSLTLRRLQDMTMLLAASNLVGTHIETSDANARVTVTLRNPWPDVAVGWRSADGSQGAQKLYAGASVTFDIPMPEPGQSETVTFQTFDRGGSIHKRKALTLTRLPAMQLRVRAENLEGSQIRAFSSEVKLSVDLRNAWPGAQVDLVDDDGRSERWTYSGSQREVAVRMPLPGLTHQVTLQVRDREGKTHDRRVITLRRPPSMRLSLSGEDLQAGQITTTADSVSLYAEVFDAWPGATLSWHGDGGPSGRTQVDGSPRSLRFEAPPPGDSRLVSFDLRDAEGHLHVSQKVVLTRMANMGLHITSEGQTGREFETTAERIEVAANLSNAWPGAAVRIQTGTQIRALPYEGSPLPFWVSMPEPGSSQDITFTALDSKGQSFVQQVVTLKRTAHMVLSLTAEGLSGERLESSASVTTVQASIVNPWPDASVGYRFSDGPEDLRDYAGVPTEFRVKMPSPGTQSTVPFVVLDGNGNEHDRIELTLVRAAIVLTVTPAPELQTDDEEGRLVVRLQGANADTRIEILDQNDAVIVSAAYTDSQPWTGAVPMPERGASHAVTVRAVGPDSRVLASHRIMLVRTSVPFVNWVVPVAVTVLLLGSAIWPIRRLTAPSPAPDRPPSKLAIAPRIYAKPDKTPTVETIPDQMPEITLTVDPGVVSEITILSEEESD